MDDIHVYSVSLQHPMNGYTIQRICMNHKYVPIQTTMDILMFSRKDQM
jgi:hypothetical protein